MIKDTLSFKDYRAIDARNWSSLKNYSKTPAHYLEAQNNPTQTTPAMLVGSAVHCLVLDGPAVFSGCYAVAPECDKRTKAGKELFAEFVAASEGKEILTPDQDKQVQAMAATVLNHPTARKILTLCTRTELSVTWWDDKNGLGCKGRIDAYNPTNGLLVDLKTTDDASPTAFARTCAKYQYHGQAAFYLDGMLSAGAYATQFLFVVVEKAPPFAVAVYVADESMIEAGRLLVSEYLCKHAECLATDTWPGYDIEVQTITLPPWA